MSDNKSAPFRIGVISDTHGLLRPEALEALSGSDAIIHAGDVGKPEIITALETIAPVFVVRGNIDVSGWGLTLPLDRFVDLAAKRFYLLHDIGMLDSSIPSSGVDAIITGHSHKPSIEWRDGLLYLNPGSAGPRRFSLPIALAIITISQGVMSVESITLPG